MFSIVFLPAPSDRQNAHNKNFISYIADKIQEQIGYQNHSTESNQDAILSLSWMEEGFIQQKLITYEIDNFRITSQEYIKDGRFIVFQVKVSNNFVTYSEIEDDMTIVTIGDSDYYFSENNGLNKFVWNIGECSYILRGDVEIDILKKIIEFNFGGKGN